jgi:4-amino-4-deoxy-L-arabinose transferase-like glycosyltransferase
MPPTTTETSTLDRYAPVLIFLLALVTCAVGIAELPVVDRDEARFAQAARQMVESGDYIDIRFHDGPRHNKPAGIYWLQSGMLHLFGEAGIWVHRLVSVLAAALASVAVIWAGLPLVGRRAALWAGLILATLFIVQGEARIAKTDATLLLTVILAMGALARVWMARDVSPWIAAAFWTALAAGFLIKGPIILMPVGGVILWLSIRERELGWLKGLRPLPGFLWFALLAAPWYIAIIIASDGGFLADSLGRDLTQKVTTTNEADGTPPGTYLIAFWITFWPWALLGPLAVVWAWRDRRAAELAFLLGWVVPTWIAFELIPTKLIHYTLPTYPALALACGVVLTQLADGTRRFAGWPAHVGAAGFALIALVLAGLVLWGPMEYGDGIATLPVITAGIALVWAGLAITSMYRARVVQGALSLALSGVLMFWAFMAGTLPELREMWITPRLVAAMDQHPCLSGEVAMVGFHEPSVIFEFGRETRLMQVEGALAWLAEGDARAAWIPVADVPEAAPGVPDLTEVRGTNYSNGNPVALRLFVSPGVAADASVCRDG